MSTPPRDRFDDVPRTAGRVGAHRAENPGMSGPLVLLWAGVAALILIVVGTFAVLLASGRITPFPGSEGSSTAQPDQGTTLETDYAVLILNGTAEEGLDASLRETIIGAGWDEEDVWTGPSSETDFESTTIFFEAEADEDAARGLAAVIGGAELVRSDFYADPDDPDDRQLTVVIGLDR